MTVENRPESVRVVLELDTGSTGLSGRLIDDRGSVSGFFGWLQLMGGLEDVRDRVRTTERGDDRSGRRRE